MHDRKLLGLGGLLGSCRHNCLPLKAVVSGYLLGIEPIAALSATNVTHLP
jgi:hypothetical protein